MSRTSLFSEPQYQHQARIAEELRPRQVILHRRELQRRHGIESDTERPYHIKTLSKEELTAKLHVVWDPERGMYVPDGYKSHPMITSLHAAFGKVQARYSTKIGRALAGLPVGSPPYGYTKGAW